MRGNLFLLIPLIVFMLGVDFYTYRGIKPLVSKVSHNNLRRALSYIFWGISVLIFAGFTVFTLQIKNVKQADAYVYTGYLVASFILFYFPKFLFIIFVLLKDIQLGVLKIITWIKRGKHNSQSQANTGKKITRSAFLYKLGLGLATIPFGAILYGIVWGKTNYSVIREKITFQNLPQSYNGLKIIQISDIHLGSLNKNYAAIAEAVELINEQEPDLILFTGDLVNNFAEETEGWAPVFSKMQAKIGKYSVMGNHDYGDYSRWESDEGKAENLAAIKEFHKKTGFRLLLNETVTIEKNGAHIDLIGVENWGQPPFPKYGDLTKALVNTSDKTFKILLSHDPSHWDAEVITDTNIDLTLAGHTHGMQFGFEYAGIKWSPIKYKYPRWGGLYREGDQFLYVNRGLGYIGFPGRIGMPPEITLIELNPVY